MAIFPALQKLTHMCCFTLEYLHLKQWDMFSHCSITPSSLHPHLYLYICCFTLEYLHLKQCFYTALPYYHPLQPHPNLYTYKRCSEHNVVVCFQGLSKRDDIYFSLLSFLDAVILFSKCVSV